MTDEYFPLARMLFVSFFVILVTKRLSMVSGTAVERDMDEACLRLCGYRKHVVDRVQRHFDGNGIMVEACRTDEHLVIAGSSSHIQPVPH